MFELSGVNYEEVLEQGDSILVRVIASSSYRGVRVIGIILYLHSIHKDINATVLKLAFIAYLTSIYYLQ